jgi:hypothetical protein
MTDRHSALARLAFAYRVAVLNRRPNADELGARLDRVCREVMAGDHCGGFLDSLAAELAEARAFQLLLAERIAAASEVLSNLAERKGENVSDDKQTLLQDMTLPELNDFFRRLAIAIEDRLPPGPSARGKCLFTLVVADTCDGGVGQYVSNCDRKTQVAMLREIADRLEQRQDIPY